MNWIFLSLLAPFIYAINVFLDKYLIFSRLPDYRSFPIFNSIIAGIFGVVVLSINSFNLLNFSDSLLILLAGMFTIFGSTFYIEAVAKEEGSVIIFVLQLIPIMVFALSYVFLGEVLSSEQFIGFVLMISSSLLITLKKHSGFLQRI